MGEQAKWNVTIKKVSSCDFQQISCLQVGCTMFIIIVAMTINIVIPLFSRKARSHFCGNVLE